MSSKGRITCPCCGESFDPLSAARGEDLGELMAILAGFGQHRPLVMDYIALFRTGETLQVGTQLKLVREIARLLEGGTFAFEGRTWAIDKSSALECMLEVVRAKGGRGTPPGFRDHNYLKRVLKDRASRREAREEADLEARRRAGIHRDAPPYPKPSRHERDSAGTPQEDPDYGNVPIMELPLEERLGVWLTSYRSAILRESDLTRSLEASMAGDLDMDRLKLVAPGLPQTIAPVQARELIQKYGREA